MKILLRKIKKTNKIALFFYFLTIISFLISLVLISINLMSFTGIETGLKLFFILFFSLWLSSYSFIGLIKLVVRKYKLFVFLTVLTLIFSSGFFMASYYLKFVYNKIGDLTEKKTVTYTSYLISLKETDFNEKSKIGMISDKTDIEGYVLSQEIITKYTLKNDIEVYEDYYEMINDLYDKRIEAIFVSSNYITLFSNEENYQDIAEVTKIIYKLSEDRENTDSFLASSKKLTEPFTVLIMGVDSAQEGLNANAAFNGDTLILMTFNPKTLVATMFSIPRDTYVPIACKNNKYAKINSSAAYGTSCVIKTIEKLTKINIDYYAKINFKGVVDLVDAVGGIEINVEEPDYPTNHGHNCKKMVCEQNSDRLWGDNTIYIKPALQSLNGEEALAYARNRGQYIASDLARNKHQQEVISALAKKMLKIRSLTSFEDIVNVVSKNISTNMTTKQVLSAYNILKEMLNNSLKDEDFITIKKSYLEVYSLPVYLGNRTTSALGYYPTSLEEIVQMMKINLEQEKKELIKTFSYSLNEDYEEKISGKGKRSGEYLELMPNFIGSTVSTVQIWASEKDITLNIEYEDENNISGIVVDQDVHIGTLLNSISKLTIKVGTNKKEKEEESAPLDNEKTETDNKDDNLDEIEDIMGI